MRQNTNLDPRVTFSVFTFVLVSSCSLVLVLLLVLAGGRAAAGLLVRRQGRLLRALGTCCLKILRRSNFSGFYIAIWRIFIS